MTARTHDAFAFASLVTVAIIIPPNNLNLFTLFAAIIAADVGSILPDIDQASNRLWDFLPAGDSMGKIFRRIFLKHRTISHSVLGVFLFYKLLSWLLPLVFAGGVINPQIILMSVMVGYISHLLADSLTKNGLPLLFPFKIGIGIPPVKVFRIRTGGKMERFFILPAVGVYLIWIINTNQSQLIEILRLVGA